MATFEIKNDGFLKGNKNSGKRTAIRNILFNLLQRARFNPDQFEATVFHDGRPDTTVPSGGCKYRNIDGKDLTVSVVVGNEYFVVKLRSRICNPQKLNQAIREALGTSVKDQFLFEDKPVCEKETPKVSDAKPQPQPQPQPKPQPQPTPQPPMLKPIEALPDPEQSFLADVNALAAHVAIFREIGDKKDHPFAREEGETWIKGHKIAITHHTVTGRLLGDLVRRGLYTKDEEEKTWSMTPLGVEVALGQKPLPADETPKKERKKRGTSKPVEPDEGEAGGNDKKPESNRLNDLLEIADDQADCVKELIAICARLKAIKVEQSTLLADKQRRIAQLEESSAGILVKFLARIGVVDV